MVVKFFNPWLDLDAEERVRFARGVVDDVRRRFGVTYEDWSIG